MRGINRWRFLLAAGLLVYVAKTLWAEDVTVSTYYPSPRAVYDDLQARRIVDYDDPAFFIDPDGTSNLNIANVFDLVVGDDLSVGGTLTVTGATTLNGATTVNNTLDVTGATTLGATLDVTGLSTLTGGLTAPVGTVTTLTGNDLTYNTGTITTLDGTNLTYVNGTITTLAGTTATYATGNFGTVTVTGSVDVPILNVSDFVSVRADAVRLDDNISTLGNVTASGSISAMGLFSRRLTS